jgi:IS30 family transposase
VDCLQIKWSPEQTAEEVGISHETIYRHIYADKAAGGILWKQLRCQKKRKKRYASGQERRGQIIARRPISERPAYIEERAQVGHGEGDAVIGANHKQAIITLVERKSGYALIRKVTNKTSELVGNAIITELKPLTSLVKTITFDNGERICEASTNR